MTRINYNHFLNDPLAEMDRFFDRTLNADRFSKLFDANLGNAAKSFRVDVYENGIDAYQVVAELPGVEKGDVDIQLENAVLTIAADRKIKQGENERRLKYSRTLTVSDDVDAENVSAELKNGLLTITLPKAESRKPKAIQVS